MIISAPYITRNGRKCIAKGTPSAMRERLNYLEKSIEDMMENAWTYTGESFLNDIIEAEAIKKALIEANV